MEYFVQKKGHVGRRGDVPWKPHLYWQESTKLESVNLQSGLSSTPTKSIVKSMFFPRQQTSIHAEATWAGE